MRDLSVVWGPASTPPRNPMQQRQGAKRVTLKKRTPDFREAPRFGQLVGTFR